MPMARDHAESPRRGAVGRVLCIVDREGLHTHAERFITAPGHACTILRINSYEFVFHALADSLRAQSGRDRPPTLGDDSLRGSVAIVGHCGPYFSMSVV